MIRSTQPRIKYKGNKFELFNVPEIIKRGDIVIESSEYGHYAGELQIAKKRYEEYRIFKCCWENNRRRIIHIRLFEALAEI